MNHLVTITKSDGTQELFEEEKLVSSLKRVGASEDAISSVSSATETSIGTIYAAGVASTSQQNYIQKSALLAGGIMLVGGTIYVLRKK